MAIVLRVKRKASDPPVLLFDTQQSSKRVRWDPSLATNSRFRYIGSSANCGVSSSINRAQLQQHSITQGHRRLLLNLEEGVLFVDPPTNTEEVNKVVAQGRKRSLAILERYSDFEPQPLVIGKGLAASTISHSDRIQLSDTMNVGSSKTVIRSHSSRPRHGPRAAKLMRIIDVPCLSSSDDEDCLATVSAISLNGLSLTEQPTGNISPGQKHSQDPSGMAALASLRKPIEQGPSAPNKDGEAAASTVEPTRTLATTEALEQEKVECFTSRPTEVATNYVYDVYRRLRRRLVKSAGSRSRTVGSCSDSSTNSDGDDANSDDHEVEEEDDENNAATTSMNNEGKYEFRVRRPFTGLVPETRGVCWQDGEGLECCGSGASSDSNSESNWRNDYPDERSSSSSSERGSRMKVGAASKTWQAARVSSSESSGDDLRVQQGSGRVGHRQYRQTMGVYW